MSDLEQRFAQALSLQAAGRFREALEGYLALSRQVLTANLACNICDCHLRLGELDAAQAALSNAAGQRPGHTGVQAAGLRLGAALLADGRYAEGWPWMEARAGLHPEAAAPVNLGIPEWTGQPLAGKSILVWVEQGFGDQIMFARFAGQLAALGARVTLAARPALAALLAAMPAADAVVPVALGETVRVAPHDYWSRYASLPYRLGVTLETLSGAPYLRAPADRLGRWAGRRGVGLMWRTSATGFNAAAKALPEARARRLLDRGLVSLQPEDTGAGDFADTAAIVEGLDLVVSVDTAVAHLAGAMGKPCWTLLPRQGLDWRWLKGRADSPWYDSMRLFRQTEAGGWSAVADEVEAALDAR
ncbi:MAG: hypothetical protein JNL41_04040 [Phenylobacterium sp.]|uniref:glycosyltransferase family 9 protein n=1 Tax=Phenylobacterium sp. TaxID=1871053 RepID=UPI001A5EAAC1|nr:glycosyltransferase family 9 protein [Phenylobacterium sp.]MBL8553425.1 hypothetical protein [Phenylobacterium sp.]